MLSNKTKIKLNELAERMDVYFKRLFYPRYLFPVKLITYSLYYAVMFILILAYELLLALRDLIIFPFRSFRNFFKSVFIVILVAYVGLSMFINYDYIRNNYGWYKKYFKCSFNKFGTSGEVKRQVVRVVGGLSEGTGFFIAPNVILTNFHVIADEPSPKIIFPNGTFITPTAVLGDKEIDLAKIFTAEKYPEMVLDYRFSAPKLFENEPLLATGYALGTMVTDEATQLKGRFSHFRRFDYQVPIYIQADMNLVKGMSGGPLTDQCGTVVGVNTITVGGFSLFIDPYYYGIEFTDKDIAKIEVDPAASPVEAVRAFYTYLKARRMEAGFKLLSQEYKKKTDFKEWSYRFYNVIDFSIFSIEPLEKNDDTVYIRFKTKTWSGGGTDKHYYQGTWQTVLEDGVYKMLRSNIEEVFFDD